MTAYSSDTTQAWLYDFNGVMRQITFTSAAEQRQLWVNMWTARGVNNPAAAIGSCNNLTTPMSDYQAFPGNLGAYDQAVSALAAMRAT